MTKRNEKDRIKARFAIYNHETETATDPGDRRRSKKAAQFLTDGDYELTGQLTDQIVNQFQDQIIRDQRAKENQLKAASSDKRPKGIVEVIRKILAQYPQNAHPKMVWECLDNISTSPSGIHIKLDDATYQVNVDGDTVIQARTTPNGKVETREITKKTFMNRPGLIGG